MPLDNEPKEAGSASAGASRPSDDRGERSNRLLGRGLDDISHLFLSQTANQTTPSPGGHELNSTREAAWSPPGETSAAPQSGSGHVLLRPGGTLSRPQLAALLKEFDGALEDGLRSIDTNLPCDPCGIIDVIAADAARRLVIIDFDVARSDTLLLRGLDHLDWAMRNTGTLRRMYPGLDVSSDPRLFLIAPSFSPLLGRAARQFGRAQIVWVKFLVAGVFGRTGVMFDRVEPS